MIATKLVSLAAKRESDSYERKQSKTLDDLTELAVRESIQNFHNYVELFGYSKAKELTLKSTRLRKVINYVTNYTDES